MSNVKQNGTMDKQARLFVHSPVLFYMTNAAMKIRKAYFSLLTPDNCSCFFFAFFFAFLFAFILAFSLNLALILPLPQPVV